MNINEHAIYKDIYNLCQEIEKLPASVQATKVVVLASELEKPAAKLLAVLKEASTHWDNWIELLSRLKDEDGWIAHEIKAMRDCQVLAATALSTPKTSDNH